MGWLTLAFRLQVCDVSLPAQLRWANSPTQPEFGITLTRRGARRVGWGVPPQVVGLTLAVIHTPLKIPPAIMLVG